MTRPVFCSAQMSDTVKQLFNRRHNETCYIIAHDCAVFVWFEDLLISPGITSLGVGIAHWL